MKKLTLSVLALVLTAGFSFGQMRETDERAIPNEEQVPKSRMEQHEAFLDQEYTLRAKPRDMWVVGVEGGYSQISGDVNPDFGWDAGIYARKALGYATSIRFGAQYLRPEGEDFDSSPSYLEPGKQRQLNNGGTTYGTGLYDHSFEQTAIMPYAEFVLNLNNINFHREQNKLNFEISAGPAAYLWETETTFSDIRDNSGTASPDITINRGTSNATREDGDLGDYIVSWGVTGALGISYRLNDRVSISARPRGLFTFNDYLDGENKGDTGSGPLDVEDSPDKDIVFTGNVGLELALGKRERRTQPMWWQNPVSNIIYPDLNDTFEFDDDYLFEDEDNDGVVDRMDKEPNSPCDFVDGGGRAIDSDGDGIVDCNDACPFTPAAMINEIDDNGCTPAPEDKHCCDDITDLQQKVTDLEAELTNVRSTGTVTMSECSNMTYPQIAFSGTSRRIAASQNSNVSAIASMLANNPTCRIVIEGSATGRRKVAGQVAWSRATAVRDALINTYGVSRDRIIVRYTTGNGNAVTIRSAYAGETGSSNPAAPSPGM